MLAKHVDFTSIILQQCIFALRVWPTVPSSLCSSVRWTTFVNALKKWRSKRPRSFDSNLELSMRTRSAWRSRLRLQPGRQRTAILGLRMKRDTSLHFGHGHAQDTGFRPTHRILVNTNSNKNYRWRLYMTIKIKILIGFLIWEFIGFIILNLTLHLKCQGKTRCFVSICLKEQLRNRIPTGHYPLGASSFSEFSFRMNSFSSNLTISLFPSIQWAFHSQFHPCCVHFYIPLQNGARFQWRQLLFESILLVIIFKYF
jgi:hypothetical protein